MTDQHQFEPGRWNLLPAPPDKCQECAVDHLPDQPHDAQSLYYQYHFYFQNQRWPTWGDAMAHCPDEVKTAWREALAAHGVPPEKLEPSVA